MIIRSDYRISRQLMDELTPKKTSNRLKLFPPAKLNAPIRKNKQVIDMSGYYCRVSSLEARCLPHTENHPVIIPDICETSSVETYEDIIDLIDPEIVASVCGEDHKSRPSTGDHNNHDIMHQYLRPKTPKTPDNNNNSMNDSTLKDGSKKERKLPFKYSQPCEHSPYIWHLSPVQKAEHLALLDRLS